MVRLCILSLSLIISSSSAYADDFPPGDAHDLVVAACTQCHVASQVTSQHKTADQWAETVTQMIGNGAKVSDSDFDKVVNYLAKNYGPAN